MTCSCPQCQQQSPLQFQAHDINQRSSAEIFNYYRCPNCGLLFLRPIPPDLSRYYSRDYYSVPPSLETLVASAQSQGPRMETVQRFVPSGRLLEIGSSYGGFAYLAKQSGYEVDVIEMDADCCHFLNTVAGIRAINSSHPSEALTSLGRYDAVVMWQVIEHLPDPWSVLAAIAGHLTPGGILALAAPNPKSLQFRLFGRRWAHLDAPRHLQLIPIPLLLERAKHLGLKPLLVTTNDRESIKTNIYGWKKSLMNLLGVGVSQQPEAAFEVTIKPSLSFRYLVTRGILRTGVFFLSTVFSPIEYTGLRGTSYTLVLQKGRDVS